MPDYERFPPFDAKELSNEDINVMYYNTVKNIVDSYHDKFDCLIELIQNSFDGLEKRWKSETKFDSTDDNRHPWLRININAKTDSSGNWIEVIDNGCGVGTVNFKKVFYPNISVKKMEDAITPTRGHKGVAMTYIIHGHDYVEFQSKIGTNVNKVSYTGGATWLKDSTLQKKISDNVPFLDPSIEFTNELQTTQSGTYVKLQFGPNSTIKELRYVGGSKKIEFWKYILLTRTAAGYISINKKIPEWVQKCKITLSYTSNSQARVSETSSPGFFKPHNYAKTKAITYSELSTKNIPKYYEMIYDEFDYSQLRTYFKTLLNDLQNSNEEEEFNTIDSLLDKYKPEIYFCLTHKNVYFHNKHKDLLEYEKELQIKGGFLVATEKMPIGAVNDLIPVKLPPQIQKRLFVLYHFNEELRPDIGRKTYPIELKPLIEFVNTNVNKLLSKYNANLIREAEDSTFGTTDLHSAQQQLREVEKEIMKKAKIFPYNSKILKFVPQFENEVVLLFFELVSLNKLKGYKTTAVPGSSVRYDMFFDYELRKDTTTVHSDDNNFGISNSKFLDNIYKRDNQWCEFKLMLDYIIDDFVADSTKKTIKYFEQINLIVAWDAFQAEELGECQLEEITRELIPERPFYGCNYTLKRTGSEHKIGVILLNRLGREFWQ